MGKTQLGKMTWEDLLERDDYIAMHDPSNASRFIARHERTSPGDMFVDVDTHEVWVAIDKGMGKYHSKWLMRKVG